MAMVDVVSWLPKGSSPWAWSRVGGRLALFCIHRVNRVYDCTAPL